VIINGANVQIINNLIHDVDYSATDTAAIRAYGAGVKIEHNTIYNAGRSGILHESSGATITYNTIHDVGLQTTEAGGTYTVNANGGGTVIAYNTIYNMHSGGFGESALFLDNNSSGYVIHNNSISNVDNALKLNYVCRNDLIYNNTLVATTLSISTNQSGDWDGTKIYNNVFNKPTLLTRGGAEYNNSSSSVGRGAGDFASGTTIGAFDVTPITTPTPVTTPAPAPVPAPTPAPMTARSATSTFQALNWSSESGVKFDNFKGLGYAASGDWAEYANINFGTGVTTFKATLSALKQYIGGTIELHIDSVSGPLVGSLKPAATGAWNNYTLQSTRVTGLKGIHNLFLVFKGSSAVANVDTFTFA
jgi:hypothetical protein